MTISDRLLKAAMEYAPDIMCCVGWNGNKDPMSLVTRALAIGAKKIQLYRPFFTEETVKRAHENGIICNVFWADEPELAREYLAMGIDCILTNDYLTVYNAVKDML